MNPQLMLLTRNRIQAIAPQLAVPFQHFDGRFGIGLARPFLHPKEWLTIDHPAFVHHGKGQPRQCPGNGLVAFFDLPRRK
ncbi:hypothetical protein D3C78_1677880 [compost metagenome]